MLSRFPLKIRLRRWRDRLRELPVPQTVKMQAHVKFEINLMSGPTVKDYKKR